MSAEPTRASQPQDPKKYLVIQSHQSEFPNPLQLKAGDSFLIEERYAGPEPWSDWFLCSAPGQEPGWVPKPVILRQNDGRGTAAMDYTAQEMDVEAGETVEGHRSMNAGPSANAPQESGRDGCLERS